MVDWQPISEAALLRRIAHGVGRMPPAARHLWDAIRIKPEKWQLPPYGDAGGGFWVVGLIGPSVIWYNDVEEGFNRSTYASYGEIADYWCNDDDLDVTIAYLISTIELGADLTRMRKRPKAPR